MALQYIDQFDFSGKSVIARFDFNVPLDKKDSNLISDTTRIDEALPTIQYLLEGGAKRLVLMSHLGRPKGKPEPKYSLLPVAKYLAEKLSEEVVLTESATDSGIKTLINLNTKIILLENLRFHPEETSNDQDFCKTLASYAEVYVNDAFGTAHRKHASTYGIVRYFKNKAFGGFLLKKEIQALEKIVKKPAHPFMALMGGAKISDKIKIIESLLSEVDFLLIGGAMAYPFLKARGHSVGKSLCANEDVSLAKMIIALPIAKKILLPIDHIGSTGPESLPMAIESVDIDPDKMGLDIGPKTIAMYKEKLKFAKTILWNGPMGLFENQNFAKGTMEMAHTLADLNGAFTVVGGGDSVSAVHTAGVADKISHISTGGGASLEFIEHGSLPGIDALKFGIST